MTAATAMLREQQMFGGPLPITTLIPGSGPGTTFDDTRAPEPMVTVPDGPEHGWKRGLTLPRYVLNTSAPPRRADPVNRYFPRSDDERAPLLPELFMPGFPKCSTTWLYSCMSEVWSPDSAGIGCGKKPDGWGADRCGKRYLLVSLSTNAKGETRPRKETFFFGGTH